MEHTDAGWNYDCGVDGDADDSESVMTDLLSPGGQTDAQTLACMLQVIIIVSIIITDMHVAGAAGRDQQRDPADPGGEAVNRAEGGGAGEQGRQRAG